MAGLADQNSDLIANMAIDSDSLSNHADLCEKHRDTIARRFEIDIR